MVVIRIRPHCTRSERQLGPVQCRQRRKNWKGKCCTTLARLGSTIYITGRLHFPEHEDDCMEAYLLRAWLQVLGLMMVMACRLLNMINIIGLYTSSLWYFHYRGSFSGLAIGVPTPCACMPMCFQRNLMTFAKARPAQMISSPLVFNKLALCYI